MMEATNPASDAKQKHQSPTGTAEESNTNAMTTHPIEEGAAQGFVATNVLTPEECADAVQYAKEACFLRGRVRGAPDRTSYFNESLANKLFERLAPRLLAEPSFQQEDEYDEYHTAGKRLDLVPVDISRQMRIWRYNNASSAYSPKIVNNVHVQGRRQMGFWQILVYLNDDFEGGETVIGSHWIKPKVGTVLCMPHFQEHSELAIQEGTKFVARTESVFEVRSRFATW